jgi:Ca2+/H+ antiporter
MGVALVAGALLAKRKRYVAHGICQTTVLLLNLGMIALVMWPSFQHQVRPAFPGNLHKWYYAVATIHSLVGGAALSSRGQTSFDKHVTRVRDPLSVTLNQTSHMH